MLPVFITISIYFVAINSLLALWQYNFQFCVDGSHILASWLRSISKHQHLQMCGQAQPGGSEWARQCPAAPQAVWWGQAEPWGTGTLSGEEEWSSGRAPCQQQSWRLWEQQARSWGSLLFLLGCQVGKEPSLTRWKGSLMKCYSNHSGNCSVSQGALEEHARSSPAKNPSAACRCEQWVNTAQSQLHFSKYVTNEMLEYFISINRMHKLFFKTSPNSSRIPRSHAENMCI